MLWFDEYMAVSSHGKKLIAIKEHDAIFQH